MTRLKIFLAGTDEMRHLASDLRYRLEDAGFDVLWFHEQFDIHGTTNAMDTCLRNAEQADLLVLLVGRRSGLIYPASGCPISEEELKSARSTGKDVLVLVESVVWQESAQFHRARSASPTRRRASRSIANDLSLKSDAATLEMLDRFQHMMQDDRPAVPWIEKFEYATDAFDQINKKWAVFRRQRQETTLDTEHPLFPATITTSALATPRQILTADSPVARVQSFFKETYQDDRLEDVDRLCCYVTECGGILTSEKRRDYSQFPTVLGRYVEAFCRLCTAVDIDIQDEALNKFPRVCAYCRQRVCRQTLQKPQRNDGVYSRAELLTLADQERQAGRGQFTLDGWAEIICTIYPRNWDMPIHLVVERVHEEQAELINSVRKYQRRRTQSRFVDVAEEVADVLSWITVYGNTVLDTVRNYSPNSTRIPTLQECVVRSYGAGCPRCRLRTCTLKSECAL